MANYNGYFSYRPSEFSDAIVFTAPGYAEKKMARTPVDMLSHLASKRNERWVVVEPYAVALCPSDSAGGKLEFPFGSLRTLNDDGCPAIPGHENFGKLVGGSEKSLEYLAKKGIKIGSYVVADVNTSCGDCRNDVLGKAPIYCNNGTAFAGIGTSLEAERSRWVLRQTSRPHLPGAYVGEGGFMVVPRENVYLIPGGSENKAGNLAVFTQADGLACALASMKELGLDQIKQVDSRSYPTVMIIGAGRLGYLHGFAIKKKLPNSNIIFADTSKRNLEKVSGSLGLGDGCSYIVDKKSKEPYNPRNVISGIGQFKDSGIKPGERVIDYVIDCTGHGLNGKNITEICSNLISKGGKFLTTSLSIKGAINSTSSSSILDGVLVLSSLTPKNEIPNSIDMLCQFGNEIGAAMSELEGGLNFDGLAGIVAQGGGKELRDLMQGSTFYTVLRSWN